MAELDPGHVEDRDESKAELDNKRELPVWHPDHESKPPAGSTEGSLLVVDKSGTPIRVSGPTHYHHLANGKVLTGFSVGTHYSEPGENGGPDKLVPIIGIYAG